MSFRHTPFTMLIHIALAIIVAGAIVTHFFGIQGSVTLTEGDEAVSVFSKSSGPGDPVFPFSISLMSAETVFYPGTVTPMDFRSHILVDDRKMTVAMNQVAVIDGWRFYQSGMGDGTSTLSVSHDPWGIGITYSGYALLGIGMIGFFFQRKTMWRALLRRRLAVILILAAASASAADATAAELNPRTSGKLETALPTMQRPLARDFGRIYVYWNDRISPLQTMAADVCASLYGATSYQGLTVEQVLAGWLFYYDAWMADYEANHSAVPVGGKARKKESDRRALISWIASGSALRIYPYKSASGRMEWLSLTERRPSQMDLDQWTFMLTSMREIDLCLRHGRNIAADKAIFRLIDGQRKYAVDGLPSENRIGWERFYNSRVRLFPIGGALFVIAVILLTISLRGYENPGGSKTKLRAWIS